MKIHAASVLALLATFLVLSACSSGSSNTRPEFMADREYQSRKTLNEALVTTDGGALTNDAIEKLLTSKVVINRAGRLAVVKLESEGDWGKRSTNWASSWNVASNGKDEMNTKASALVEMLLNTKIFKDVSSLPVMLLPAKPSLAAIREMAARFQAGTILVYRQLSVTDEISHVFSKDEAKASVVIESALIDTRTGAIPFTSMSSEEIQVTKTAEETQSYESVDRAKDAAAEKALKKLVAQLEHFLKNVP